MSTRSHKKKKCTYGCKDKCCESSCSVPYVRCPRDNRMFCKAKFGDCDKSCGDDCIYRCDKDWSHLNRIQEPCCPDWERSCTVECCPSSRSKPCCKKSSSSSRGGCGCGGKKKSHHRGGRGEQRYADEVEYREDPGAGRDPVPVRGRRAEASSSYIIVPRV